MRLCANGGDPGIDRVFHILADTTAVTFNNMTIRHGRLTSNAGGGVYCRSGNLTLDNCKVTSNYASSDGGGINFYILGSFDESLIIRNNSSIDHNKSDGDWGGGIYNSESLELKHVTIAGNHADSGSGGGIYNIGSSFSVMEHTILGNNAANACPDFYSDRTTIASEQYNLIENDTDCGTFNPASASTTDIFGQDPLLDPLADNGGPTQTHALQDTSPAIDAGDPLFPDPNPLLPNDQRTSPFLRVIDGTIDIGAYESGNVAPIPTINEWGMLMLALLISGSAVWSLRRKRKEL